jgi:hypothetical protein
LFIGDILVAHGLVTPDDVASALERQKIEGGRLGENLIALGTLKPTDLDMVLRGAPPAPSSIVETGLDPSLLLSLAVKAMYSGSAETPSQLADILKLPPRTLQLVIEEAKERKLVEVLAPTGSSPLAELRYRLIEKGRQWALEALAQSQYIGPAPVSHAAYVDRIQRQRITNERLDRAAIDQAFDNLVVSEEFVYKIGPAVNSGNSILLYGPAGNGKTSVAERIGEIFTDLIYVPYCFEVGGQIVKVFDASIHKRAQSKETTKGATLRREDFDARWVLCSRPFITAGGELTLEMLDLSFNGLAKFYEAPLHVKALGGVFLIDDFGRQIVSPKALLNRWIVPLESRVDYLKLHTGKSFSLPFDELVIFSTNLSPSDLMDAAFLRRIPYKLEVGAPNAEEYRKIFQIISKVLDLEASDEIIDLVLAALRKQAFPLASYQPKFIVSQVRAACKFQGVPAHFEPEMITMALSNLYPKEAQGQSARGVS